MSTLTRPIDCLIISVGRSASTAIYKYFNDACLLDLPANKEPHYWCDILRYQGRYDLLNNLYINNQDEYFGLYSGSEKVIDASVGYFFNIEEVISNLKAARQKPKVIFLYRDPISRARSLFNELEKKGLTESSSVDQEVRMKKDAGLWWENYYDNVMYMDHFKLMESYFDELLLVNYDAFAENPAEAFSRMAAFVGVPIMTTIDFFPVNTSAEAKLKKSHSGLKLAANLLPHAVRSYLKRCLIKLLSKEVNKEARRADEIAASLPQSVQQYEEFRRNIEEKDILCLKK